MRACKDCVHWIRMRCRDVPDGPEIGTCTSRGERWATTADYSCGDFICKAHPTELPTLLLAWALFRWLWPEDYEMVERADDDYTLKLADGTWITGGWMRWNTSGIMPGHLVRLGQRCRPTCNEP